MTERANIRDVSAHAGVSVKTVSRVLNDHPYVRQETREKVERAIRELDFKPNMAARILAGTKSGQIALIHDNHSASYMHEIQVGSWEACQKAGVRLLSQPVDVADPQIGKQVRSLVTDMHVDGVILSWPVTDSAPVLGALEMLDVPFVRISPGTDHAMASSVAMDDVAAAEDMTHHLIAAGHRRIGFVKGHPDHTASADRLLGYRRALDRAAMPFEPQLVAEGRFDFDSGVDAGTRLLDLPHPPTAIFASNDDMAAGVLAVAHERGLDVPDSLSVAGFADTIFARMLWPKLTTIRQPTRALARTAAELLLARETHAHRQLPHLLVERDSVGPRAGQSHIQEKRDR